MRKYICIFAFGILALGACRRSALTPEEAGESLRKDVVFTADASQFTTRATDSALESGDEVGIFALEPIGRLNVKASVNGNKLAPETPVKWRLGQSEVNRFIAYLPYQNDLSSQKLEFNVKADQRQWSAYSASDLRFAVVDARPESDVHFLFQHALCKLIVVPTGATVESIATSSPVVLGASVDLGANQVSVTSNSGTLQLGKAVSGNGGTGWVGILPPQTGLFPLTVKTKDGRSISCKLESPATFEPGFAYRADITIPSQGSADVTFKLTVVDWADDGTVSFHKNR